jgi:hypothetical protein
MALEKVQPGTYPKVSPFAGMTVHAIQPGLNSYGPVGSSRISTEPNKNVGTGFLSDVLVKKHVWNASIQHSNKYMLPTGNRGRNLETIGGPVKARSWFAFLG